MKREPATSRVVGVYFSANTRFSFRFPFPFPLWPYCSPLVYTPNQFIPVSLPSTFSLFHICIFFLNTLTHPSFHFFQVHPSVFPVSLSTGLRIDLTHNRKAYQIFWIKPSLASASDFFLARRDGSDSCHILAILSSFFVTFGSNLLT